MGRVVCDLEEERLGGVGLADERGCPARPDVGGIVGRGRAVRYGCPVPIDGVVVVVGAAFVRLEVVPPRRNRMSGAERVAVQVFAEVAGSVADLVKHRRDRRAVIEVLPLEERLDVRVV